MPRRNKSYPPLPVLEAENERAANEAGRHEEVFLLGLAKSLEATGRRDRAIDVIVNGLELF